MESGSPPETSEKKFLLPVSPPAAPLLPLLHVHLWLQYFQLFAVLEAFHAFVHPDYAMLSLTSLPTDHLLVLGSLPDLPLSLEAVVSSSSSGCGRACGCAPGREQPRPCWAPQAQEHGSLLASWHNAGHRVGARVMAGRKKEKGGRQKENSDHFHVISYYFYTIPFRKKEKIGVTKGLWVFFVMFCWYVI